jgi:uncharacterized protein (DUF934 family)
MKFIDSHTDRWHRVGGEDGPDMRPKPHADRLLTLEQWHAVRDTWPTDLPVAVALANTVDVEALAPDLGRIALVVLHFPKWTDGRAYSQGHVLRSRLRYRGEVRATGDVLVDMLPLLARTGIDAVQLRHDQNEDDARRVLGLVTDHYQGDVVQTRPLFSRVVA